MEKKKFNDIKEILHIDSTCINTSHNINAYVTEQLHLSKLENDDSHKNHNSQSCKHLVTFLNVNNEKKTELYLGSEILLMTLLFNFNNYDIDHFIEHENVINNNKMYDKLNNKSSDSNMFNLDPIHVKPMDVKTFDEEYELLNKLYEQSKKK